MKVLVLTGPESSGKSWLSNEIRNRFGGVLVGEYVRYFIEQQGRDTFYSDIPDIARGQLAWEDAARATAPPLLILDTHLLSNLLWSKALFGDCPPWIEQQLLGRHYDLHLLLSPEGVDWVNDGQRCQPQLSERQAFFEDSRQWLDCHAQSYQIIGGNWTERREQALAAVSQLLTGSTDLMLVQQPVEGRPRNA
ncbi:AAA family ATPase [Pseudomonas sp. NPDC089734]|uniref:AAA family ATPase n=1 Tax=Pseudomonas sp. NPDC089734 TaxID=3364469 RepID=UPI00380F9C24